MEKPFPSHEGEGDDGTLQSVRARMENQCCKGFAWIR